jgi:hypothetical protein
MLLKAGVAGLDDADCARTRITCSTGSKPGALALLPGCGCDDVCCAWSGVVWCSGVSSRAVLVLSSNVVGVGEEPVSLPDWWGADFQVFIVLMVRDALRGIKPPTKTSQSWLSVVWRRFWLALSEGLSLVCGPELESAGQHLSYGLGSRSDTRACGRPSWSNSRSGSVDVWR